jgi:hypothetical protein
LFKRSAKSPDAPKVPRAKREKSTSTKGYYVTNAILLPEVIRAKALGFVTPELHQMIRLIAERYSRKSNFIGYSFREDMVASATFNLYDKCNALRFDTERGKNPFSYYTSAIHNSFLQCLGHEKNHRNIRDALIIDAGSNPSYNFMQGEKDEQHFEIKESDEVSAETSAPAVDVANFTEALERVQTATELAAANALIHAGIPLAPLPKENYVRHPGRQPGTITVYSPEDYTVDEKGNITIINQPPVDAPAPVGKTKLTADHVIGAAYFVKRK